MLLMLADVASRYGHDEILRLLMKNGYPIDKKGFRNMTVLHHAAWENKHSTVRMLLKDFNGREVIDEDSNDSKDTPLTRAIRFDGD